MILIIVIRNEAEGEEQPTNRQTEQTRARLLPIISISQRASSLPVWRLKVARYVMIEEDLHVRCGVVRLAK